MSAPDTVDGIREKLNTARTRLLESFAALSHERMTRPYGEGDWSIKDILAHVAMAESVNVAFAKMMVDKESPVQLHEFAREYPDFPGEFELDKFNAWMTERWRIETMDEVVLALRETRAKTLAWLETLTPSQLERTGEHAMWGWLSVRGMFRILVIHDRFHLADIEKRKTISAERGL